LFSSWFFLALAIESLFCICFSRSSRAFFRCSIIFFFRSSRAFCLASLSFTFCSRASLNISASVLGSLPAVESFLIVFLALVLSAFTIVLACTEESFFVVLALSSSSEFPLR